MFEFVFKTFDNQHIFVEFFFVQVNTRFYAIPINGVCLNAAQKMPQKCLLTEKSHFIGCNLNTY